MRQAGQFQEGLWVKMVSLNIELELRKQAIKFDSEIIYWMSGFRLWIFVMVVIGILSLFFWWVAIGGIAVSIWMMVLIQKAIRLKMTNHDGNVDKIERLENAK